MNILRSYVQWRLEAARIQKRSFIFIALNYFLLQHNVNKSVRSLRASAPNATCRKLLGRQRQFNSFHGEYQRTVGGALGQIHFHTSVKGCSWIRRVLTSSMGWEANRPNPTACRTFNLTRLMHLLSYPGLVVSPIDFAVPLWCLFAQVSHSSRLGHRIRRSSLLPMTADCASCIENAVVEGE